MMLLAFLLIAPEPAPMPKLAPLPTLQGYYHVAGESKEGGTYEGTVTIQPVFNGRYYIRWALLNHQVYEGIGDLDGEALWTAYSTQNSIGLTRFRVGLKDGKPHMVCDRGIKEEWTWLRGFDK